MHKDWVKEVIDRMPEDSTLEDIQYTIYAQGKILKGLEAVKNGNVVTQEELEKRMERWLKQ